MPVAPTYPGVYIEELPSGVRTITGVATSIAAFIGRASHGPVNEPTTVNGFADFERKFGGLGTAYPMSYSVRDFFLNGGAQAVIVRLFAHDANVDGLATFAIGGTGFVATNPGTWANSIVLSIDDIGITQDVADRYGLTIPDLFNLNIDGGPTGPRLERFANLSIKDNARRIDRILNQRSNLVRSTYTNGVPDIATPAPTSGTSQLTNPGVDSKALGTSAFTGSSANKTGMYALLKADTFNILCIPPDLRDGDIPTAVWQEAMPLCVSRRAMLIVDPPVVWSANKDTAAEKAKDGYDSLNLGGLDARNAAIYFPRVVQSDPLRDGQLDAFVPCGIAAGIWARTDTQRGVWKSPAGLDAAINGIHAIEVNLSDAENGMLNPLGINCLRSFPVNGKVVWGARTLRGADQLADEYKYVAVRRTALFIEESLYRGTQWVVFEPNDVPLWAQIRLNVGAFMHNLFRQGAFQGKTPREAYLVKCDSETTTQNDINLGIVNILVGFAPLKPAEFVIIKIQQLAGQIEA